MNPLLGRWISADPLAVRSPGSADANLYAYVVGRILVLVDPLGLQGSAAQGCAKSGDRIACRTRVADLAQGRAAGRADLRLSRKVEELRFEAGHAYDRGHYDHAYRLQAAANLVETLGHSRQEASKSWQKGYEIGLTTEASSYVAGDIVDIIDLAKPYWKKFKALSVTGPRSKALAQKAQKHRRFFADLAESLSVDSLKASRRYTRVVQLQNSSGHGVDIMAKNAKTGRWEAFEIKSTTSADGRFELSAAQAKGSEAYSRDRLRMIAEGSDPEKAAEARKILRESSGYDIEGTVVEVNFFDGSVRSRQWMEQPKKSE